MTLAPPKGSGSADGSDPTDGADVADAGPSDDLVVHRVVRQRKVQRRHRRRRLLLIQSLATLLFVALLIGLGYVGWRSALRITGGNTTEVTDPAAPGYVAAAKPTDVTLIAFSTPPPDGSTADPESDSTAADQDSAVEEPTAPTEPEPGPGLATMLLVIGGSGDEPPTAVPIPAATTLWDFEESGPDTASGIFATGGIDVLRLRLGADLTFGPTVALDAPIDVIEQLAAQRGPVTLSIPDDVLSTAEDGTVEVRYAAGELTLQPEEVVDFMEFTGSGESESNHALRLELVWTELLSGSDTPEPSEPPEDGDDAVVVEQLLAELTGPEPSTELIPMIPIRLYVEPPVDLYKVDEEAMPAWVSAEVPFPVSAYPGQRPKVELLNGTTDETALRSVAPQVVDAGGEIAFTGNAESFQVQTSRVEYSGREAESSADRIAATLGLTATLDPEGPSNVDVVVVVGADRTT